MDFEVLCLGSRDMTPVKGNDCSHYLINGHILVDCGTSPIMNLLNLGVDVGKVDTLIFTHMHPDHCVGLPSLLYYFSDICPKDLSKIKIYGPSELIEEDVKRAIDYFMHGKPANGYPVVTKLKGYESFTVPEESGDVTVKTVIALHSTPARSLRFEKNGAALGVSGDTYPIPELPGFFKDCDALIFETSFGRLKANESAEEVDKLKQKFGHASSTDVAHVANKANVKRVYLTHTCLDHADRVAEFSESSDVPVAFLESGDKFTV